MTKRVVLIGHPVAHSLSGAMQQAAFDTLGIDASYELWDRAPIALADAIAELRTDDFLGANVTIPHKERVVPQVDRLTEEAHATGAVNTLTKEGRKLVGHNTDVPGFKVALDQLVGRQKMPRHAVVLGAGGGARAVVYGLIREGFQRVIVFNRHLHRGGVAGQALRAQRRRTWTSGRCPGTSRSSSPSWPRRRSSSTRRRSA